MAESTPDREFLIGLLNSENTSDEVRCAACKRLGISSGELTAQERVALAAAILRRRSSLNAPRA